MEMNKERFLHITGKYLQGTSTPQEERELLRAIESSAAYKTLFREEVDRWTPPANDPVYDGKWEKIATRITPQARPEVRKKQFTLSRYLQIAAVITLLVIGGLAAYRAVNKENPKDENRVYLAALSQDREIVLPDSSLVYLREGSSLSYTVGEKIKQRFVKLEGEAFFDVQPDPARPFLVEAGGLTVRVLGTSFSVDTRQAADHISVVLLEGAVSLLDNHRKEIAALLPGQKADYSLAHGSCEITEVDSNRMTLWRKGIVAYENVTFEEILELLSSHFHKEFRAETPVDPAERFSGAFLKTQSPGTVIEQIEKLTGTKITLMDTE